MIDIDQVEGMITKKTRAIMVPSLIGNIPDFPRLKRIAKKHKLWLVEDSADTLGAKIAGKSTGEFTDISTTSFYASHVVTTGGHGGMICFNKDEWYDKAKTLVGWGRSSAKNETEAFEHRFSVKVDGIPYDAKFVFEEIGYNFQSTDIDAAFGLEQLKRLKSVIKARQEHFADLLRFFKRHEDYFVLPKQRKDVKTAWLAFPLVIRESAPFNRVDLAIFLEKNGIQTRPLFTGNALRQPAFKNLSAKKRKSGYPVADSVMRGSVVIGCHQGLERKQVEYVKERFETFVKRYVK